MLNIYTLTNKLTMNRILITLVLTSIIFVSCNNRNTEKIAEEQVSIENTNLETTSEKLENYAVVWKWITKDEGIIESKISNISIEMNELWGNGVIYNTYFNKNFSTEKAGSYPNISCFLKAKNKEEAHSILNNLTFVEEGVAEYTLHPVGTLWLGRNTDKIKEHGITNSYVTVWATVENFDPNANKEIILDQTNAITSLWAEGKIENAYWDITDTYKAESEKINNKRDFVFFVNANTEEEAKEICNNLPFIKENLATYKMASVGVFWLGENK